MSAKTIAEKILSVHSGTDAKAGQIVMCDIDWMMCHDANGPMAIRTFHEMGGVNVCDPKKIVFVIDHAYPAPHERAANMQKMFREFAREQGIKIFQGGEGVCHQLLPEMGVIKPGDLCIGTDSHTCTYGALGAFATGVGASDMGAAMLSGKNWFRVPETIRVDLIGKLPTNCSAKDVILTLIGMIGADGGNYKAIEIYGEYLDECSEADRLTISNMIVEMGGKAGFLCRRDYGIEADLEAEYEARYELNLTTVTPAIAKPHTVDNFARVSELAGMKFDAAFLGSCTNGRIEDLRIVADVLRGNHVADGVRLLIAPASKTIQMKAIQEGIYEDLLNAGATITSPGCAVCCGTHEGVMADGEVCLSSTNRNFKGRMGNNKAFVYLVSPKTLAVSCLYGVLTEPKE